MNGSPARLRRMPPSPRNASLMRKLFACGWKRQVGGNWWNSRFAPARAVGHRQTIAGRDVGIRGVEVDLARAARRQDHGPGDEAVHRSRAGIEGIRAEDALRGGAETGGEDQI